MARRLVHTGVGDHVADGEAAAGAQHPRRLGEDGGLVGAEVDDAVADDHVDRVIGQRDVLDRALDELDVLDPSLGLVAARQVEHLVGHVEAIGLAGRTDPPSREQDVDPAAGAQVEHRLALVELGDSGRVATAEARELRRLRQRGAIVEVVETGAEQPSLLVGDHRRVTAAGCLTGARSLGSLRIARADGLAELACILGDCLGAAAASSGLVLGPTAFALGVGLTAALLSRRRTTACATWLPADALKLSHPLSSSNASGST